MILLFDCGNTNIKAALANENNEIVNSCSIQTDINKTSDDYYAYLKNFLDLANITGVAISSVVPLITDTLINLALKHFKIKPVVVSPGIKTNIFIKSDNPSEVGADIICDAVSVSGNSLVIDLGTCNKYIYVNDNKLLGVIITPGVKMQLESLNNNTALLPLVAIKKPKKILATNTIDAIRSGIFYSLLSEINYFIKAIEDEVKTKLNIYLTGGIANQILNDIAPRIKFEKELTLKGLLLIYNKNKGE